jgi:hypothetical protein
MPHPPTPSVLKSLPMPAMMPEPKEGCETTLMRRASKGVRSTEATVSPAADDAR